jgi:tRNA pseudouridine38-40 synthase
MARYFIQLSFRGKNYHGWQIQANAHSVQAELNKALHTLAKEKIETTGCGRTDTGVHAKIFFAHLDLNKAVHDKELLVHRLNCILPNDIAVQGFFDVEDDAHARFDAVSRTYEYQLYNYKDPFLSDYACFTPYDVDLEVMNELCEVLTESHSSPLDYSCFSKNRTQTKTNDCKITEAHWKQKSNLIIFRITADRFLRNMVRAIVGTMLLAGKGKLNKRDFHRIIETKKRSDAGASVPAHGLYLADVKYPYKLK